MLFIAPHPMTLLQELQARLLEGAEYRIAILSETDPPQSESSVSLVNSTPVFNAEPGPFGEPTFKLEMQPETELEKYVSERGHVDLFTECPGE